MSEATYTAELLMTGHSAPTLTYGATPENIFRRQTSQRGPVVAGTSVRS
jgi:hypothetical protein